MLGADFFLTAVAGAASTAAWDHLRRGKSLRQVVLQSLRNAVEKHQFLLQKHTRALDGSEERPEAEIDGAAFARMWEGELRWDPNAPDFTPVAPRLCEVIVLPGCPLAPEDQTQIQARVLTTARAEFVELLPGNGRAKQQWDVAHHLAESAKRDERDEQIIALLERLAAGAEREPDR